MGDKEVSGKVVVVVVEVQAERPLEAAGTAGEQSASERHTQNVCSRRGAVLTSAIQRSTPGHCMLARVPRRSGHRVRTWWTCSEGAVEPQRNTWRRNWDP